MSVEKKFYKSEFGTIAFIDKVMVPKITRHHLRRLCADKLEDEIGLKSTPVNKRKRSRIKKWYGYATEYHVKDPTKLDITLDLCNPFEFEDTLKILRINSQPILESQTDGYKYLSRISEMLKLMVENGIPKGGIVSGMWKITRDLWKNGWYLSYLGPPDHPS